MIDADSSESYTSESDAGTPSNDKVDDYTEYMADMILEMQRMATKTGRRGLAETLGVAYERVRENDSSK